MFSAMTSASCNTGYAFADEDDAPAQPGPRRRATRASAAATAPDTGMWSLLTVVLSIWRNSTISAHVVVMLAPCLAAACWNVYTIPVQPL